jgi:hypothetical protein
MASRDLDVVRRPEAVLLRDPIHAAVGAAAAPCQAALIKGLGAGLGAGLGVVIISEADRLAGTRTGGPVGLAAAEEAKGPPRGHRAGEAVIRRRCSWGTFRRG